MGEAPLRLPSMYMKISLTTLEESMSTVQGGCWAAMLCASWASVLRMVKSIGRWPTAGIHTGVRMAISGLSGAPTTVESRTWLQHQVLMPNGAAVRECRLLSELIVLYSPRLLSRGMGKSRQSGVGLRRYCMLVAICSKNNFK